MTLILFYLMKHRQACWFIRVRIVLIHNNSLACVSFFSSFHMKCCFFALIIILNTKNLTECYKISQFIANSNNKNSQTHTIELPSKRYETTWVLHFMYKHIIALHSLKSFLFMCITTKHRHLLLNLLCLNASIIYNTYPFNIEFSHATLNWMALQTASR